jgi:hypothetical protein
MQQTEFHNLDALPVATYRSTRDWRPNELVRTRCCPLTAAAGWKQHESYNVDQNVHAWAIDNANPFIVTWSLVSISANLSTEIFEWNYLRPLFVDLQFDPTVECVDFVSEYLAIQTSFNDSVGDHWPEFQATITALFIICVQVRLLWVIL